MEEKWQTDYWQSTTEEIPDPQGKAFGIFALQVK